MKFNPISVAELIDCLRAGWTLRWVPDTFSGRRECHRGQLIDKRTIWLNNICDADHQDLHLEEATYEAFYAGKLVLTEDEETGIGRYWLADQKHPSNAQTQADVFEEMKDF